MVKQTTAAPKDCKVCGNRGGVTCAGCSGSGRDKKNGNPFERYKCYACQGLWMINLLLPYLKRSRRLRHGAMQGVRPRGAGLDAGAVGRAIEDQKFVALRDAAACLAPTATRPPCPGSTV